MSMFCKLKDGLITWRQIGHGLWPLRDWPDAVIVNYVTTLKAQYDCCSPDPFILFQVNTGKDLIRLIRHVLSVLPDTAAYPDDSPVQLLETILFALIGMVCPEEPGELSIEEILMNS